MYQDWMKEVPVLEDIDIKNNTEEYLKYWEKCPHCGKKVIFDVYGMG